MTFKAGDVVNLRSGGPPMTVSGPPAGWETIGAPEDGVTCVWQIQGAMRRETLSAAVLRRYRATPRAPGAQGRAKATPPEGAAPAVEGLLSGL